MTNKENGMKRITAIITAAALCAALCGCAKTEESSSSGGYYFAADNGAVETKQEKLEKAVESYVRAYAAPIYGSYDGIRIGGITEDSGNEYSATGKYWVLDSFGDRHCYKFRTTVRYSSGKASISSDYTDWKEY